MKDVLIGRQLIASDEVVERNKLESTFPGSGRMGMRFAMETAICLTREQSTATPIDTSIKRTTTVELNDVLGI